MRLTFFLLLLTHSTFAQVEPQAGSWKTFVIDVKDYKLPAPPDKAASALELKEIQKLQLSVNSNAVNELMYWNAGAPGYRWNEVIMKLTPPGIPSFREMALLNVAIYDATIAAWEAKYRYNRPRPANGVKSFVPVPNSPSYPCEYSVGAGAAYIILAYLYPAKADSFNMLAQKVCASRLLSGVQYPSDVKEGFELGKRIAEKVLERAKADGADIKWTGSVPATSGLWNGKQPIGATYGKRKPWVLDSTSEFRPTPPPDFAKDMEELRNYKQTQLTRARAYFYATQDEWSELTNKKIFEYNLQYNAPRAARVYALKSIAFNDAILACWEAKFYYWGIRPDQYDTTFKHSIMTPPFPGYPSGHATTSNAVATVLAYLFPGDSKEFYDKAVECAESRFEGGIHFRTDNVVGLDMGHKIGGKIVEKAAKDGSGEPMASIRK